MVDKSQKVVWLMRLGHVARGVVYGLLGYLALSSTGSQVVQQGQSGVLSYIEDIPFGVAILYVTSLGLLGYALFRFASAFLDSENHGSSAKGLAKRFGHFCSAVIHIGLAWTALQYAIGAKQQAGDRTGSMVQTALSFDIGNLALAAVGIGLIVGAIFQAKDAITLGFMKRVSGRAPSWTCWAGRAGYAARSLVFLIMGGSLIHSGWSERSSDALSLGDALLNLQSMDYVHTAVAAGFVLFGVFSIIVARYRIIPDPDPGNKIRSAKRSFA